MARTYRQGARREGSSRTRARVLEAAHDLFAERGYVETSIDDVAGRAGVARVTVYQHFGSKLGLLEAICELIAERGLLAELRAAFALSDPVDALVSVAHAGTRFWASEHALFQEIYAVSAIEPGALAFVTGQRDEHRSEVARLVARLAGAGALREGLDERRAVAAVFTLTGFHVFDELVRPGGLTADEAAAEIEALVRSLCRSGFNQLP